MSLSSISSKSFFYEKMNVRANEKSQDPKKDGFRDNLEETKKGEPEENLSAPEKEPGVFTGVQVDYNYCGAETAISLHQSGRLNMNAVFECRVRHMDYSESDLVRVCVTEGYTLKAKVEMDSHMVYIEQKNEDGSVYAYEVNPLKLSENTKNPIEQTAVEAWEKARDFFNGGMAEEVKKDGQTEEEEEDERELFQRRLEEFHAYVKQRIKEGPPKIQIGGSEFSEEEWEQLMKKIDEDIDAYKEELRQRILKQKEESEAGKEADSAAETKSLAETAGVKAGDGDQKGPEVSETEALKGTKQQASSSFLARLFGEKKAPYSYLADDSGMIVYKGVCFVCDDKKQTISLGDMTNPNKVLNIPLSKGGVLRVNVDNIGDLVKAVDMFSPEDIARILKAVAKYKKVEDMELEIEEMKAKSPVGAAQEA